MDISLWMDNSYEGMMLLLRQAKNQRLVKIQKHFTMVF